MGKSSLIYLISRLVFFGFATVGLSAFASPLRVIAASGVSSFTSDAKKNVVSIFGGVAGPACTADGKSTCNSCPLAASSGCMNTLGQDLSPLCSCNEQRIYDSLIIHLELKKPAGAHGNAIVAVNGPTYHPIQLLNPNNGGKFVEFTWAQVCSAMGNASNCESVPFQSTISLVVGIDQNGNSILDSGEPSAAVLAKVILPGSDQGVFGMPTAEGISGFTPFPGDGRAFVTSVSAPATFPTLSYGSKVEAIRLFQSSSSMLDALPSRAERVVDLRLAPDGTTIFDDVVDNLTNGKTYFLRMGMLDEAKNLVQFYPPMATLPASCTSTPSDACPFAVKPDKVHTQDPVLMGKLAHAIADGDVQLVDQLSSQLSNIDEPFNDIQETPLTLAAINWQSAVADLLIRKGASVNHRTTIGYSSLMFVPASAYAGPHGGSRPISDAVSTIKLLLKHGALKNFKNYRGETAYDIAVQSGHPELAKLLQ